MKRLLSSLLALAIAPAVFASGAGSVPSMGSRNPHDDAVQYYNSAERRLEKLTKMHDEMKAATDPQKAADLRQKISKGLEAAAADFRHATDNDPNLFQAYSELGFTLRKLGRYDESLAAYDKALALQPGFSPAIEYRAEAHLGLNKLDDVKDAYMTLFAGDRPRADVLMVSIKSWLAERRANLNGLDAAKLDEFAKWVEQRQTIAGQTSSVTTADTNTFRSW
ncbi:MAG: tetratricopeptide repeat protein [Thermoanaerobaculia bacterium]